MSKLVWYFAKALQFLGILLVGYAIIVGVGGGVMAQEYLYWGVGFAVFLVGSMLAKSSE